MTPFNEDLQDDDVVNLDAPPATDDDSGPDLRQEDGPLGLLPVEVDYYRLFVEQLRAGCLVSDPAMIRLQRQMEGGCCDGQPRD